MNRRRTYNIEDDYESIARKVWTFAEVGAIPYFAGRNYRAADFQRTMEAYQANPSKKTACDISTVIYNHALKKYDFEFHVHYDPKNSALAGREVYKGWRGFDISSRTVEELAEKAVDKVLRGLDDIQSPQAFYSYCMKAITSTFIDATDNITSVRNRRVPLEIEVNGENGPEIIDNNAVNEERADGPEFPVKRTPDEIYEEKYEAIDDEINLANYHKGIYLTSYDDVVEEDPFDKRYAKYNDFGVEKPAPKPKPRYQREEPAGHFTGYAKSLLSNPHAPPIEREWATAELAGRTDVPIPSTTKYENWRIRMWEKSPEWIAQKAAQRSHWTYDAVEAAGEGAAELVVPSLEDFNNIVGWEEDANTVAKVDINMESKDDLEAVADAVIALQEGATN